MALSFSPSRPAIFDGTDTSIGFLDFVRELQRSTGANPSMDRTYLGDILPAHLYGPALRYYESLHPVFSQEWDRLCDVMAFRFPGPLRSGGLVWRSSSHWVADGLWTVADRPPPTATPPGTHASGTSKSKDYISLPPKAKRYLPSTINIKEKLRLPLLSRLPSPSSSSFDDQGMRVTVYSFYIESEYGGTAWSSPHQMTIEAKVDLDDQPAVTAAKKEPLITIPSSHAKGYRVGFSYRVNYGRHEISFWHHVLAPKEYSMVCSRSIGYQSVSPVCLMSNSHPITEFIYDRGAYIPNYGRASPGKYTVKSHIRIGGRIGGTRSTLEDVGEVTWKIDII